MLNCIKYDYKQIACFKFCGDNYSNKGYKRAARDKILFGPTLVNMQRVIILCKPLTNTALRFCHLHIDNSFPYNELILIIHNVNLMVWSCEQMENCSKTNRQAQSSMKMELKQSNLHATPGTSTQFLSFAEIKTQFIASILSALKCLHTCCYLHLQ